MIQEIFINKDLSSDFETEWLPLLIPKIIPDRKKINANTICFSWNAVEGEQNGQFLLLGSADCSNSAVGTIININSSSTLDDSWIVKLSPNISFLKVKFKKNGISSGIASAYIEFQI